MTRPVSYLLLTLSLLFNASFAVFAAEELQQKDVPASSPQKRETVSTGEEDGSQLESTADDLQYFKEQNKIVGRGNVAVTQNDVRLMADYAEIYTTTKKAYAQGHVVIIRDGKGVLQADKAFYDFGTHQASIPKAHAQFEPWFMTGEQVEQVSKNQLNMYEAVVTSCPFEDAHYDIKAKRAVVYPGDKLIAWNVTFRILKVPVFWWPYLVIPLDAETGPFELRLGTSKLHGNYAQFAKTIAILPQNEERELKTKVNVGLYKKRGTAVGDTTWYHFNKVGDGDIRLYWLKDERAPDPFYFQQDARFQTKQRYRISWRHRTDFATGTHLIGQYNEFSDPYFLHDFFNREFNEEPIPQTFMAFTHDRQNYGILVDIQKQANDFDNVLERLPEVRFNWRSTEIPNTGVYYDSSTSYANLHSISHNNAVDPTEDDGRRKTVSEVTTDLSQYDTSHAISYPRRFFRYYDVTPNGTARWTFFNHNAAGENNESRRVLALGGEFSTRLYRFFNIPKGQFLGIKADRVRHLVRPVINYSATRHVDTRPELLHPLASSASISDVMQFGVENRVQAKTDAGRVDLVSLNPYITYEFNNPNNDTRFTTGSFEIILRPYSWFRIRSDIAVDLKQHRRTSSTTDVELNTKYVDWALNHRYSLTSKDALVTDRFFTKETDVITFSGKAKINELWKVGGYCRWEIKRHSFREYEWFFERDLHDWDAVFGQNIRHSELNVIGHELFFEIRLKALPGVAFETGTRSNFAEARIGETVSGANIAPPPPSLITRNTPSTYNS